MDDDNVPLKFDCIVVGSGHAGSCAAFSAVESGCKRVLVIDKCPKEWAGGNGYFTAGAFRTVHDGLSDLMPLVKNIDDSMIDKIDMSSYSRDEFVADIMRLGQNKADSMLVESMVDGSRDTVGWLGQTIGIPFMFSFHRQAYEVDGRYKFWGGMVLSVENGGKGLISAHQKALERAGVDIWFDTSAVRIIRNKSGNAVTGLWVRREGSDIFLTSPAIILAAGGFEANAELRAKHLGPQWGFAKVRGTKYNTGECFSLAQEAGAAITGDWGGCHSTAWDAHASNNAGARDLTNQFTKSGYPLGIMVNRNGLRFVDEGEDFRNYTYAKFGRAILNQPGGFAFQVWDSQVISFLRKEEYGEGVVQKIVGTTLEDLARNLVVHGLEDETAFVRTIEAFNEAVREHRKNTPGLAWNPAMKDGLSTQSSTISLTIPKSNWALAIEQPPFVAVKVACGITFTFGGLKIDPGSAAVLRDDGSPIEGLFCTGEMVGDLFYNNYPGGSGLMAGAVFGRRAGQAAARAPGARLRE